MMFVLGCFFGTAFFVFPKGVPTVKKICLLALCILLLAGCAAKQEEVSIPFAEGQLYAVAWLGYGEPKDLPLFEEAYALDVPPVHYVSGGEYYLVIPRYEDMKLELLRNDLASSQKSLFYEEANCEAFVLCCNVSDIIPDVTVRLTRGEETVEFSPCISLKDGSVQVGDRGLLLKKE